MSKNTEDIAVIFDMDGLLVESEHLQSKSFEIVLARHGVVAEYNEAGTIQIAGITSKENFELIKKKHHIPISSDELVSIKNEVYSQLIEDGIDPMPGAHRLIESLKKGGVKTAVASSSIPGDIERVLKQIGLFDEFDSIVSGSEVEHSKPAPDIFLEAARRIGADPSRCIVLEDAEAGVKAAKSAGMFVIAVPNKYTSHNDFSKADVVVNSLEELNYRKLISMLNDTI